MTNSSAHLRHLAPDESQARLDLLNSRITNLNNLIDSGTLSVFDYIEQCQDQVLIETHLVNELGKFLDFVEGKRCEINHLVVLLRGEVSRARSVTPSSSSEPQDQPRPTDHTDSAHSTNPNNYTISVLLTTNSTPISNHAPDRAAVIETFEAAVVILDQQLTVQYSELHDRFDRLRAWIEKRQAIARTEMDTILDDLAEMGQAESGDSPP